MGHELVISHFVGTGGAVGLPRLGDKQRQGFTKDKNSRAEVLRVGPHFAAVRPFNVQWSGLKGRCSRAVEKFFLLRLSASSLVNQDEEENSPGGLVVLQLFARVSQTLP